MVIGKDFSITPTSASREAATSSSTGTVGSTRTRRQRAPTADRAETDLTLQEKAVSDIKSIGKFGSVVARDLVVGTGFQLFSILEKLPSIVSAGHFKETHHVDRAWQATQRWVNPYIGLDESYVDDYTDISKATEAARKAGQAGYRDPVEFAKQAGISGFWSIMAVAGLFDVAGATKAVTGVAKGFKYAGKAKKFVDFGEKGLDVATKKKIVKRNLEAASLEERASNLEQTEFIKLTGASKATEDAAESLTKTLSGEADKGVKSTILPMAVKESEVAAKEARLLSGNYLPIPKKIDSAKIDQLAVPVAKLGEVTGLEKSTVIAHNAFAKAFNKVAESRIARALNTYNKEGYDKLFGSFRTKYQQVIETLVRKPEAMTQAKLKKMRLELEVLKDGLKNDLNDLATKTNFEAGVLTGLTESKRKKLLTTLHTAASKEIDEAVNNAFKIAGKRRKLAEIDAELLADLYEKKLDDLKSSGISVKATKKAIKGDSVAKATRKKTPAAAAKALQDNMFKNYATIVGKSVRPHIKRALDNSNVLTKAERGGLMKQVTKHLSDFKEGKLTAEQLQENLNATLIKDGSSVINNALQRKKEIAVEAERLVRGYNLEGPLHSAGYDPEKTKELVKTVKGAKKQFEAKVKAVGQEAALDTPEHIAFSNAVNDYGEALNLQHFSYKNLREISIWDKVGRLTVGPYVTAVKKVINREASIVDAAINTLYVDAYNTSQIIKKFTLADGRVQPLIADTLIPALRAADRATDAAKNLNRTTVQTIDSSLRDYLRNNKKVSRKDLFRKGTLSHHAQYYSALLLENLTSSKLDISNIGTKSAARKIDEIAGALTRSLKEHGVDTAVTSQHVRDYIKAIDATSGATRMASKKKAMHAFRRDVLKMDGGAEKIFDDQIYPYLDQTREVYNTKVKDGYSILYGEGAPQEFDYYMPLHGKEGNLADDTGDLNFFDLKGIMSEQVTSTKTDISTKTSSVYERNDVVSDKSYSLNGEDLYTSTTEQAYRFGEAAASLERAKQILKNTPNLNQDVKNMLIDNLSKIVKQKGYKDTPVDAFLRWNAGLRVATFLFSPQFLGGVLTSRGVESIAGLTKTNIRFQQQGVDFIKRHKDVRAWIADDVLVNRLDTVDSSRVDAQMLGKLDNSEKTTIRGSIGSKERLANIASGLNTGLGNKALQQITKFEDKMQIEVASGILLEKYFDKLKKANPKIDIKNMPEPTLNDLKDILTDADFSAVHDTLDSLYGAHLVHRRSPASASADGITSMMTLMASWSLRNKQRLGTAYMRGKVKKAVGNEIAEQVGLTFDNAPSFYNAITDMVESEATYQLGRILVKNGIRTVTGTGNPNTQEDFAESVRDNLLSNAVSVGWAGQQMSDPVIDLIKGYGFSAFENLTDPLSPVIKSGNLAEAASKGLEHWTFLGNMMLNDTGVLAPFVEPFINAMSIDEADSAYRSEVTQIFRQHGTTKDALDRADQYYANGSEITRSWSTIDLSSYKERPKAREEILKQALAFPATDLFEKAFSSADNRRLSQIKTPSAAVKEEGEVARQLRSVYTLITMSDSDWLALRKYADEVALDTGKSSWRTQITSWDRFRNDYNGKVDKYAVKEYLDEILISVQYKSEDRNIDGGNFFGRMDKQYFGDYGKYQRGIESILGGLF